jgi:hypothetical protein
MNSTNKFGGNLNYSMNKTNKPIRRSNLVKEDFFSNRIRKMMANTSNMRTWDKTSVKAKISEKLIMMTKVISNNMKMITPIDQPPIPNILTPSNDVLFTSFTYSFNLFCFNIFFFMIFEI